MPNAVIKQKFVRLGAVGYKLWPEQIGSYAYEMTIVNGYDTQYEYMDENLVVEEDTIVERIGYFRRVEGLT